MEKLFQNPDATARTIARHLAELTMQWTVLQERHYAYVIELVTAKTELSDNETLINNYTSEFLRLELVCDKFISLCDINKPIIHHHHCSTLVETTTAAANTSNSIKLE